MAKWTAGSFHIVWIFYDQGIQNTFLKAVMKAIQVFFFLTWVLSNFWLSKDGNDDGALYLYKFLYLQSSLQFSFYFHLNVTIYPHEAIWAVVLCTFYGWEPSQVFLTLFGVLLATPSVVMEPDSTHSWKLVRHVSAQPSVPITLVA